MKYAKLTSYFAAVGIALMAVGCSDNPDYNLDGNDGKTGQLDLSALTAEVDDAEIELARAGNDIDLDPFLVTITDADGREVYAASYADRNEIITLPVATGYTVAVKSHEPENAAWSAPLYQGSKTFDIEDGKITAIGTVTCTFANIRVSVRYTDQLKNLMGDDCNVEVKCSENGALLNFIPAETRSGYFKALEGSTTLGAHFTGTVNGQQVSLVRALNNVAAGQHRIITFGVKSGNTDVPDEFGGIAFEGEGTGVKLGDGLWLDMSVTTEDINGNVVVDDPADSNAQRPGENEGGETPTPPTPPTPGTDPVTITTPEKVGLSLTSVNVLPIENPNGIVNIHADKGISNLRVQIISTSDEFNGILDEIGMPKDFDLAHTKDAAERAMMEGFEFPVDEKIIGQKDVVFDITSFIGLLVYSGDHNFVITVTDSEGNSHSATLAFTKA